jgi:DNA-binding NarL/FixJ family response regulator
MSEAKDTREMRALVVEDDGSWQRILEEILSDMGLSVDVADSVESAASVLQAAAHRLAVVDLSLGGTDHHNQDGLQVLDAVRRRDPSCVAILLTGFATVELAVSALTQHGAYTCLRKEAFRRAEFRQLVQQALVTAPAPAGLAPEVHQPAAAAAEPAAPQREAGRRLVLVVEDDAGWRSILAELLADMGQRVRLATSYGEALGWLRRQRFDLAIVDLSLASWVAPSGNQDGYHVLANTRAAAIPTIVVSGAASPRDVERAYAEFAIVAYLEKQGFDRAAFRSTVANVLPAAATSAGSLASLTSRELDVLKLLAQGLPNREIAAALVISTNTVKRHLKAIFTKLGVSTRAAATAKAVAAGLTSPSDTPAS